MNKFLQSIILVVSLLVYSSSFLHSQIEVRLEGSSSLAHGSLITMGSYASLPGAGSQQWSIVNTGSTNVRISSMTFIDTAGVNYSATILNSGFSIVFGEVPENGFELGASKSHDLSVSFFGNREGQYYSTFKIEYFLVDSGSTKAPEPKEYILNLSATVEVLEPVEPEPEPIKGEPIPSSMQKYFPAGFPTEDILYYGGNSFKSTTLGSFDADPNNENRFIHEFLGPLVWTQDPNTFVVTLISEWWGNLYTATPGVRTELGFEFPYVKSELTGNVYFVNVDSDGTAPFYNHRQINRIDVGWQNAIGVELTSAENYYKAAETTISQMQNQLAALHATRDTLSGMPVEVGSNNLEASRSQGATLFKTIDTLYGKFLWYRQRLILSPQWIDRLGGSPSERNLAVSYTNILENNLTGLSTQLYAESQTVLYNQIEVIYQQKVAERTHLENALKQAKYQKYSFRDSGNDYWEIATPYLSEFIQITFESSFSYWGSAGMIFCLGTDINPYDNSYYDSLSFTAGNSASSGGYNYFNLRSSSYTSSRRQGTNIVDWGIQRDQTLDRGFYIPMSYILQIRIENGKLTYSVRNKSNSQLMASEQIINPKIKLRDISKVYTRSSFSTVAMGDQISSSVSGTIEFK